MAIDTTNYTSWKQVRTPSGGIYYAVPNSSLVFDPILSQSKGQNVFHPNPQAAIDDRQRAIDAQSPVNQLLPVAGSVAGTVGAGYLLNQIKTGGDILPKLPSIFGGSPGAIENAPAVVDAATNTATSAAQAFNAGATSAPTAVGSSINGGTMMSDGSVVAPEGSMLGAAAPYLGAGAAALGAYNTFKGWGDGNKDIAGGALAGAGTGLGLAAAAPLIGLGPLGWGAMGLMALGGAGIGGLGEMFTHKKTKQYQAERWGELSKKGVAGVDAIYAANHAEGDDGIWKTGKYAGQKWTFDKAKDLASEDPTHFQQVYGNLKTFGSDWQSYGDAKQKAIVSALVQNDLYKGDKGDVVIKDEKRAREIKDQVLAGTYGKAPAPEVKTDTTAKDLAKRLDAGRR